MSTGHIVQNMVCQCQSRKKLWAGHRQTNGQSDSDIPPGTSLAGGRTSILHVTDWHN